MEKFSAEVLMMLEQIDRELAEHRRSQNREIREYRKSLKK